MLLSKAHLKYILHAHTEFQMAVQNDRDRIERLIVSLARPGHPLTNFVWGYRESLKRLPRQNGVNLVKVLKEYYILTYTPPTT